MKKPYVKKFAYYKDDILYDVNIVTDKIARSKMFQDKSNIEHCEQIQSSDIEPDASLISSLLNKYASMIASRCGVYVTGYTNDSSELIYEMEFPISWIEIFSRELDDAIRDYIVNSILSEYLSIVEPAESPRYLDNASQAYSNIKKCITARIAGTVFRPAQP
ncbi:MAG: hypothetical protein RRY36_09375 [Bacteroidaceae bacterium]